MAVYAPAGPPSPWLTVAVDVYLHHDQIGLSEGRALTPTTTTSSILNLEVCGQALKIRLGLLCPLPGSRYFRPLLGVLFPWPVPSCLWRL